MVRRHQFGPEGHAYVRRYLESGARFEKRLGALLLDHHDVDGGSVWAFVRADSPPEKLAAHETGRLFPKGDPDWATQADRWLRESLSGDDRVLLIEHPYAKPTDGWLRNNADRRVLVCGDDLYECYLAEDGELVGWLGGATWEPYTGVIAPASPDLPGEGERRLVQPELISSLSEGALAVIVGAWDDEGWIVWEPDGPVLEQRE